MRKMLSALVGSAALLACSQANAQSLGIVGVTVEGQSGFGQCQSDSSCRAYFSVTPPGKTIKIESASCTVTTASPVEFANFGVYTTNATNPPPAPLKSWTMDARLKSSNVEYFYTSELLTPILIGPGRFAGVQIITRNAGRILIGCQLSGTVIAG